jgi:hypothetical protein
MRKLILLVFTALACLRIQQVRHAKAVNTNLRSQIKRGDFESLKSFILCIHIVIPHGLQSLCRRSGLA